MTSSIEFNKSVVRQFADTVNARDWDRLERTIAADFVRHSSSAPPVRGRDELERYLRSEFETFPDGQESIEDVVAEGDKVAVRHSFRGTQLGAMGAFPPSGRVMTADYLAIYRLAGGLIVEAWAEWDNLSGLVQLGHYRPGMERHLRETRLLDFNHPSLTELVKSRGWMSLSEYERIAKAYDFVQNEIAFGYNEADDIPASRVHAEGYGQCNTKGTLLMALLRGCGIPCRFHAFTIDKNLQKGAISGLAYHLAPRSIIHSWVEAWFGEKWVNLEGFILDRPYLESVQGRFPAIEGPFCGYAVATSDFRNPPVEWKGADTYIQKEGINHDFGIFDDPDSFYASHGINLSGIRRFLFRHVVRKRMNSTVSKIRRGE